MNKNAVIEFLKQQLASAESEQKKAQAAQAIAATLPQWDTEVQALKFLLARHAGTREPAPISSQSVQRFGSVDAVPSVSKLTVRALTEAGKPQSTAQILGFLASHGKRTTSATLRSTIWQHVKNGKQFKVVSPGIYGLLEWENR